MFNLNSLPSAEKSVIEGTLTQTTFPWETLGLDQITVEFTDLSVYHDEALIAQEARLRRAEKLPPFIRSLISSNEGLAHYHVVEGDTIGLALALANDTIGIAWFNGELQIAENLADTESPEVFLAMAAHLPDYFTMNPQQRSALFRLYYPGMHDTEVAAHNHGWFDEAGDPHFWDFVGEPYMVSFIKAYAPTLPINFLDMYVPAVSKDVGAQVRKILTPEQA